MAEGKTYALTTYVLVTSKLALFSCPGEVADEAGLLYLLVTKELTPNPILGLSKDWLCFFKKCIGA